MLAEKEPEVGVSAPGEHLRGITGFRVGVQLLPPLQKLSLLFVENRGREERRMRREEDYELLWASACEVADGDAGGGGGEEG